MVLLSACFCIRKRGAGRGEIRMKIVLLLLGIIAFVPSGAPATHWIGLFADLDHSVTEEHCQGMFDVYLFHRPTPGESIKSAELLIAYPEMLVCIGKVYCDDMILVMGDITSPNYGASITWTYCAYDWKWSVKMSFLNVDFYKGVPAAGYIRIVKHPASDAILHGRCDPDFTTVVAQPITWFYFHCSTATEESSWGAIKNVQ